MSMTHIIGVSHPRDTRYAWAHDIKFTSNRHKGPRAAKDRALCDTARNTSPECALYRGMRVRTHIGNSAGGRIGQPPAGCVHVAAAMRRGTPPDRRTLTCPA